jgi:mycobactin peptide synthetase MbtF
VAELRAMLGARLPRYMIPQRIIVVDRIPLTDNGKLDEAALTGSDPDVRLESPTGPETPTEAALADLLSECLAAPETQRDVTTDFVELGLDSIVALSVVRAARRRGIGLRARLILETNTVRDLAAAVDAETTALTATRLNDNGPIPLLPAARWIYEYGSPRRLGQVEAIRLRGGIDGDRLRDALAAIVDGHEMLRTRLDRTTMTLLPCSPTETRPEVLTEIAAEPGEAVVADHGMRLLESLDPERGVLLSGVWLVPPNDAPTGESVLLLAAHVLALDPVSWRVVLGELDAALTMPDTPVREHTGYRRWAGVLAARAGRLDTAPFWASQLVGDDPDLGVRRVDPDRDRAGDLDVSISFADAETTARLLDSGWPVHDVLVTAAARTVTRWRQRRGQPTPVPLLALETHGRAHALIDEADDLDTTETVGLLTAIYPLRMSDATPAQVGQQLAGIPGDGIDYGLLRYLRSDTAEQLGSYPEPQLLLNYLGRADLPVTGLRLYRELLAGLTPVPEPDLVVRHELSIFAAVLTVGGQSVLTTQWRALPSILSSANIAALQGLFDEALREILS